MEATADQGGGWRQCQAGWFHMHCRAKVCIGGDHLLTDLQSSQLIFTTQYSDVLNNVSENGSTCACDSPGKQQQNGQFLQGAKSLRQQ